MSADTFFDTNVAIYALIDDAGRKPIALRAIRSGGVISVQVVNELTHVLRRKFKVGWDAVDAHVFDIVCMMDDVRPITATTSARGRYIAERHNLQFYDSLLLASALEAGCTRFVSEDMHHGLSIDGLTVENLFRDRA
jgi:predicted nucleic acid-binding protein